MVILNSVFWVNNVLHCSMRRCVNIVWLTIYKRCCFQVCDNDVLGRHLVATRNMKTGEIVIKESPLLWGPSQVTGPVCLSCLKNISESDSEPCDRCGWPLCLEPACKHAAQHRPECQWAVDKRKAPVNFLKPFVCIFHSCMQFKYRKHYVANLLEWTTDCVGVSSGIHKYRSHKVVTVTWTLFF